jgi:hypothetical protein
MFNDRWFFQKDAIEVINKVVYNVNNPIDFRTVIF